jgi:hypothetical protein
MRSHYSIGFLALGALLFSPCWSRAEGVDLFASKVAPIFRERCVRCHHGKKAKGGLDLTARRGLMDGGASGTVVVPGKADKSFLVEQISGPKPKMPREGKPLGKDQVAAIRQWIDQGAPWPDSLTLAPRSIDSNDIWWSLRPLRRPAVPRVKDPSWVRTPIDAFVLASLEARGMKPSGPADRATLIRRVTFDLLGLPPTPAEIDAFVADADPQAYEQLIDRLLGSPHYGERWARHWLDVAHYADTHGYDKDKRRDHAWPYRDYVIRAFNQDKRYADFIREQVAGDVLRPDDPEALTATGFIAAGPWDHVGHRELREGTVDKKKTRLLDRDDMVANTISTFVSMTAHCARCHDHKFDPIPQKDYYRLQAVFAGVDRGDRPLASRDFLARKTKLENARIALAEQEAVLLKKIQQLTSPELAGLDLELSKLRKQQAALPPLATGGASPSNGYHSGIEPRPDVTKWVQVDLGKAVRIDEIRLIPARPTDFPDTPGFGFPVHFRVEISSDPKFIKADVVADHTGSDFPNPGDVPVAFRLSNRSARHVRVTATQLWKRVNDYVFALAEVQVQSSGKNVAAGVPVTALDSIEAGRWSRKYLVDGFDSRKSLPDLSDPKTAAAYRQLLGLSEQIRQKQQARNKELESLIDGGDRASLASIRQRLASLHGQIQKLGMTDEVYAVLSHAPRPIHRLHRGNVEDTRELLGPGALSAVPGLSADFQFADDRNEGKGRLALAQWLADPKNVLTWRSIVNRIWHYHFGRGLVATPNDFGRNGGVPTHPELLDWLAVEFRDGGQSFKRLHRLILLSNTYRQASGNNAIYARLDADNRFLWRMNRRRLDAESIRDTVLAVSGKLSRRMGGPGFELFRFENGESPIYDHSALEKINDSAGWRRTVYRFTVRSVPNPFLECLDCADPNINTPVRNMTLTALQALALLNDPFMIKQAELFAERLKEISSEPSRQIEAGYLLTFGRRPMPDESRALTRHVGKHGLANACRLLFNANEFVFID